MAAICADECVWLFTFSLSNSHIRVGTLFGLFTVIHGKNITKDEADEDDDEENAAIFGSCASGSGGGGGYEQQQLKERPKRF